MEEFIRYINYLVLQYECVIIPDFGGFVVNYEPANISQDGYIVPPFVTVGFNSELKYNDGLLAREYMEKNSISYERACNEISELVRAIKKQLDIHKELSFGQLGNFSFVEDKIVFTPSSNKCIHHPAVLGFSSIHLLPLHDILKSEKNDKITSPYRKLWIGVGSAAAACILFLTGLPFINSDLMDGMQKSGFLSSYSQLVGKSISSYDFSNQGKYAYQNFLEVREQSIAEQQELVQTLPINEKRYFIIVGSETDNGRANKLLSKFQEQFENAAIVESPDRLRIYVKSFADKEEANAYLESFRIDNPSYQDAWLFTKTVRREG